MNFAQNYLSINSDKFNQSDLPILRNNLESIGKEAENLILQTQLKSTQTALILSIFLGVFGVDRFYVGNVGLGIIKLLFSWLTFGIWVIIDWFLISKACRNANFQKICSVINLVD